MPNRSQMTEAELDRIAAGIRPSWELDDAPFRPGGLASPELEALLALGTSGNGVSHSHTNGAAQIVGQRVISVHPDKPEAEDMLTRVDPVPPVHVLEEAPIVPVRVEAASAAPLPVPQFVAEAAPQSTRAPASNRPPAPAIPPPSVRPPVPKQPLDQTRASQRPSNGVAVAAQADPFAAPSPTKKSTRAKATDSADFPAIKKSSNKNLFIALGGVAIAAVIAIVVFSSSSSSSSGNTKVSASPTATQMPGTSTTHEIPPPPAADDLPAATAQATAAPTQTAAPTATQVADVATTAPVATTPPTPTHVAHVDSTPPPPHHTAPPATSKPPSSGGGGGKGKGGIVRDVPF